MTAAVCGLLASCDADATLAQSSDQTPLHPSGVPAQPLPAEIAGEMYSETQIIAQQNADDPDQPACTIRFAYAGYREESLIWRDEPCSALTMAFFGQDDLERLDKWGRLDEHARERIAASPDGKVLYVEGAFTASIYPIDINQLTYEVVVAD